MVMIITYRLDYLDLNINTYVEIQWSMVENKHPRALSQTPYMCLENSGSVLRTVTLRNGNRLIPYCAGASPLTSPT